MDTIVEMITSLGFPAAVCVACFWFIRDQARRHSEELDKLRTAIDNNTRVLTILVERMSGKDGK